MSVGRLAQMNRPRTGEVSQTQQVVRLFGSPMHQIPRGPFGVRSDLWSPAAGSHVRIQVSGAEHVELRPQLPSVVEGRADHVRDSRRKARKCSAGERGSEVGSHGRRTQIPIEPLHEPSTASHREVAAIKQQFVEQPVVIGIGPDLHREIPELIVGGVVPVLDRHFQPLSSVAVRPLIEQHAQPRQRLPVRVGWHDGPATFTHLGAIEPQRIW